MAIKKKTDDQTEGTEQAEGTGQAEGTEQAEGTGQTESTGGAEAEQTPQVFSLEDPEGAPLPASAQEAPPVTPQPEVSAPEQATPPAQAQPEASQPVVAAQPEAEEAHEEVEPLIHTWFGVKGGGDYLKLKAGELVKVSAMIAAELRELGIIK